VAIAEMLPQCLQEVEVARSCLKHHKLKNYKMPSLKIQENKFF
jgi:hypothetical protein